MLTRLMFVFCKSEPWFGDRFGGDAVYFRAFQSENISCEIKTSNLPTSFSEHLAGANAADDDLVYVVGGIVFVNDLTFAGIRSDDADTLTRRTEHLLYRTLISVTGIANNVQETDHEKGHDSWSNP